MLDQEISDVSLLARLLAMDGPVSMLRMLPLLAAGIDVMHLDAARDGGLRARSD